MTFFRSARKRAQIDVKREFGTVLSDSIQIQTGAHGTAYRMRGVMGAMSEVPATKSLRQQSFHRQSN
jgi:hypothetical protein